jgi:hypothetical protein
MSNEGILLKHLQDTLQSLIRLRESDLTYSPIATDQAIGEIISSLTSKLESYSRTKVLDDLMSKMEFENKPLNEFSKITDNEAERVLMFNLGLLKEIVVDGESYDARCGEQTTLHFIRTVANVTSDKDVYTINNELCLPNKLYRTNSRFFTKPKIKESNK